MRPVRRVAMLSVHTSPLDHPGGGDAGGMNVYIAETAKRMAAGGTAVEIFTRATSSEQPPRVEMYPGVTVRNVIAGPFEGLCKADLPAQLCMFTAAVLRAEAFHEPGWYDIIHSHYWLSGQVGWLARDRWGVPLVHMAHTLGKVKNASLAEGDAPEPLSRIVGEEQVVAEADRLVASTDDEAHKLIEHYDADPDRIAVVAPGVDLEMFSPGSQARERRRLGVSPETLMLLFVGRIQPLKAPDLVLRIAALLRTTDERPVCVFVLGAPSGSGLDQPNWLTGLSARLGIDDVVQFRPPVSRQELAAFYRAADLTIVPSYTESFGLVALESQACGTPVIAARVGGLSTAVAEGVSGVLVDGHDPIEWAAVVQALRDDPFRLARLRSRTRAHAERFSWDRTTAQLLDVYHSAIASFQGLRPAVND
jgi:D-inositol-3-phosphate glycosyltransferase